MIALAADTETRLVKKAQFEAHELADRIALFAVVSKHPRPAGVLDGLTKSAADAARRLLLQAADWSSGQRQARVALEFGTRGDQHERLAALMAKAPPVLRLAMCAKMTPAQQSRFERLLGRDFRQLPGRNAFAARLVREASR